MSQTNVQVLVVGGGPGGYSCAIRAAQLGLDVLLVERKRVGGTCLHAGCIPSKAIIHAAARYSECAALKSNAAASQATGVLSSMGVNCGDVSLDWQATQQWKDGIVDQLAGGVDGLLAKAGVQVLQGSAQMLDGKRALIQQDKAADTDIEVHAQYVVLAVGAREVSLPGLPVGGAVLYARDALKLPEVPNHLAVVGGGYIGLELGQAFARLGSAVTVVEAQDRILPAYPKSLVAPVAKALVADGVSVLTDTRAKEWRDGNLEIADREGTLSQIQADKVLVAVGRCARLDGWGREQLALDMADGFIAIDSRGETSMSGVYAVGDLTGEPMLAHRAIAQGHVVAECLAGRRREFSPAAIPAVCFTQPEIASVGETGESARAASLDVSVSRFPLSANGRALTLGATAGFIEVVADSSNHVVLGVQAVGEHVAELVHSFTLAIEMGARLEDVADTIHAHPTIGEAFAEASMAALGLAGH